MKAISGIIGLILILTAVVIIVLSTNDESYAMKKGQMVTKYVTNANQALDENDFKQAIKFAIMAIEVDPKNKSGFKIYEKALELKYKPSQEEISTSLEEETPAEEEIEEAPDMGC